MLHKYFNFYLKFCQSRLYKEAKGDFSNGKKTRINNIVPYLPHNLKKFRIVSSGNVSNGTQKMKLKHLADGDLFIPSVVGPHTHFNAEGAFTVRKDLPKENRYVTNRYWTWRDWGGHEHSSIVDIYRDCYPRDKIDAPGEEFLFLKNKIYSRILDSDERDAIKHIANMFLEIFGEFDFVDENFAVPLTTQKVNFEILPPGEYPFEKIKEWIKKSPKGHEDLIVIKDRLSFFEDAKPNLSIIGLGGYQGYIGYQFGKHLVFDNTRYGNAIYVFNIDAKKFIGLSKKQILDERLHLDRVVHAKGWKHQVKKYLIA